MALSRVNTNAPSPCATETAVSPWIATRFPYPVPLVGNTTELSGSNKSSIVITAWVRLVKFAGSDAALVALVAFAAGGSPSDASSGAANDSTGAPLMFRLTATSVSSPLKRIALGPTCGGGGLGGGNPTVELEGGGDGSGGGGAGSAETTRFTPASHRISEGSDEETTVICGFLPSPEGRLSVDSSPPSSNAQYATKESYDLCHATGGIAWCSLISAALKLEFHTLTSSMNPLY